MYYDAVFGADDSVSRIEAERMRRIRTEGAIPLVMRGAEGASMPLHRRPAKRSKVFDSNRRAR